MAGRIREDDIAAVREQARIDDVVSAYVTLRNAGGGSYKGLCPFHDEKTPSFHVTPSRGFYHCFGCQAGGDVINFLMAMDGVGFTEAVERLAEQQGLTLRREDDGEPARPRGPQRGRLVEAHRVASEFYAEQLTGPDALVARQFLAERGFDREAAEAFGLGFAPRGGDVLYKHLRQRGFTDEELVTAGLVAQGRSHYDRFRGRLLWPIRDPAGDTIGFGARRLFDDDRIEAKYLNTPESPIYKKSQVLYGIDRARKEIGRTSQVVLVEGYTDVMAAHLAGVGTAVATCGTAFGDEHARVLRRYLHDHEESRGEVIFTFDGDEAGQRAARKAFAGDQNFVAQTYVAVEQHGLDPCDLRVQHGDAAVRELVAHRTPLYRFVLAHVLRRYDLDRADARVEALREAATLVASVRDRAKVDAFARELAGMIGVDVEEARTEVRLASARPAGTGTGGGNRDRAEDREAPPAQQLPDLHDPRYAIERETLKLLLQYPGTVAGHAEDLGENDFTHPTLRGVWAVVVRHGGPAAGARDAGWATRLRDGLEDEVVSSAISMLAVEPVRREPDAGYVAEHVLRLRELTAQRRIDEVKSRLQRTNPQEQQTEYNRMFGELVALEQHRRSLRDQVVGLS